MLFMKRSKYKKLHRELWQWLVDNPTKHKTNWPQWKLNGGKVKRVTAFCFACGLNVGCAKCPIPDWGNGVGRGLCSVVDSYYVLWCRESSDFEKRRKYAEFIRDAWE